MVIAPLSTIGNWQREFETWTDINAIVYHGSAVSRNNIQQYEMYYKDEKVPTIVTVIVLRTNFGPKKVLTVTWVGGHFAPNNFFKDGFLKKQRA